MLYPCSSFSRLSSIHHSPFLFHHPPSPPTCLPSLYLQKKEIADPPNDPTAVIDKILAKLIDLAAETAARKTT
jgi:hypothetical protein